MVKRRGRRVAMWAGAVGVLVLAVATWLCWPHLRFWWLFERLGVNAQGYPEYRHRQTGIVMVKVPGGTFWMGAQKDDPAGQNYEPHALEIEGPVHQVKLSPFLIGKFEVTQAEWERVLRVPPRGSKGEGRQPVHYLFWDETQEFCQRVGLTLPTEAQWEYACRAGTQGAFAARGELEGLGWYRENSNRATPAVGEKRANDFGIYDMHGGAEEWCQDAFDEGFYQKAEARMKDPLCSSHSEYRVTRGGSWRHSSDDCRSAARRGRKLGPQNCAPGFRLAFYPLP